MFCFVLNCPLNGESVEVAYTGELAARGAPAFRGFSCESEGPCERAGIACALYDAKGAAPFSPGDAWKHLNG